MRIDETLFLFLAANACGHRKQTDVVSSLGLVCDKI